MEKVERLIRPSIRMGEFFAAVDGTALRTLLGSCVGLVLYDQRQKVGGLAHIVLPFARGATDHPGKYADTAVPALVHEMQQLVGGELKMIAKLAGGASMFRTTVAANIGVQNIATCEQLLGDLRIPIVARHCGGTQGRRMSLDTSNGKVLIEIVGQETIEL